MHEVGDGDVTDYEHDPDRPVMITDREWKIGDTFLRRGTRWRVTGLEPHPIGLIPWVVEIDRDKRVVGAYRVLEDAKRDREWENYEDPSVLLDQLVPYAEEVAKWEGIDDVQLVLERELDL